MLFEKYNFSELLLEFYTTLLDVSDVSSADSFAHLQLSVLNSEKYKHLKKQETLFETNTK